MSKLRKIVFWTLIAGAVGCAIGGIFFTPILPVAVVLVGAASAVSQSATPETPLSQLLHAHRSEPENQPIPHDESEVVEVWRAAEHLHMHRRDRTLPSLPESFIEPQTSPDVEADHHTKARPSKSIHKHHP